MFSLCEPLMACSNLLAPSSRKIFTRRLNGVSMYWCKAVRKVDTLFLKVVWSSHGRDHLIHFLLPRPINRNFQF